MESLTHIFVKKLKMKPTELKLEKHEEEVIRRIYVDVWEELNVCGGARTWFIVLMRYLHHKGYELKKTSPERGERSKPVK